VADGIGGRLFAAYLGVLWDGTRLAPQAAAIGLDVGRALVVSEDVVSLDRRFVSMTSGDQRTVIAWALRAVRRLRAERLRAIEFLLRPIEPVLLTAVSRLARRH